ncbi:hypothetical protein GOP47_0026979 [Adiantum capillus-veneris]|nr:hypothetical protein GOP47_0026979 [Adiantum capillus-veneris]
MVAKKPRVVIIGAGMAGLSAARQLVQAGDSSFDLTLLEASSNIGGRIATSEIDGNRVELGATWIHGMEGSPLYKIAQEIGATMCTKPFERQDGFPGSPIVKAEGGLTVPPSIVSPVMELYKKLLDRIRSKEKLDSQHIPLSIGAFVASGLGAFLCKQNTCQLEDALFDWLVNEEAHLGYTSPWTVKSLQEALFAMNEQMERVDTSANTLYDLDLKAEKEYKDYPGEHVTIPGGYISIINELASSLPEKLIHFGKKVEKIAWNRTLQSHAYPVALHCSDGSVYEADHVIVTVSLGVLKAAVRQDYTYAWDSPEGRHVCRSVDELLSNAESASSSLFEPALPPCKVEAISRLGYGLVNKVFLQLNTDTLTSSQLRQLNSHIQLVYRSCEELKEGPIPWWMRQTFSLSPIYDGSCVLLCWFAGSEALELEYLSDEEIMSGVAQTLASFGMVGRSRAKRSRHRAVQDSEYSSGSDSEDILSREDSPSSSSSSSDSEENFEEDERGSGASEEDYRNLFTGILRSRWGRNPLFHGSYSFVATGASGDDIEMLAEPLPALNAGEFKAFSTKANECNATEGAITRDGAMNAVGGPCEAYHATCGPCELHEHRAEGGEAACNDIKDEGGNAHLQLLFAGEATVRALYSTTHGAHLSGLREAKRLLNHYALPA